MDRDEFLKTSHAPAALHGAFSPSEWQARSLNPNVAPPSGQSLFARAQMPLPFREVSKLLASLSSDLRSKREAEPVPAMTNRFAANGDTAFEPSIFQIPERKRTSKVKHYLQTDDLRIGFKIDSRRFRHGRAFSDRPARLKGGSSDKIHFICGVESNNCFCL